MSPQVVIACPVTGEPVPTGFAIGQASFAASDLEANTFTCPECGQMHTWDKIDAWVAEDGNAA